VISVVLLLILSSILLLLLSFGVIALVKKGQMLWFLLFLLVYLAIYQTFQILLFDLFGNSIVLTVNKLFKESLVILLVLLWVFSRKDFFGIRPRWRQSDYLMLLFLLVPFVFVILPIGPSSFVNKAVYFKGILMLGLMYFLGRVMVLDKHQITILLNSVLIIAVSAFCVTIIEKLSNTHFQSLIPYEAYQIQVNKSDPTGNYGLTWTFEAASGDKRFAAFFSNPLEMASVMMLSGALALYLWLCEKNKVRRYIYGVAFGCTVLTLLISFSRASFVGFILLMFFAAYLLGYWRILVATATIVVFFFVGLFFFGGQDLQYFIIDTLTFTESSSAGHVIEWVKALESIVENPLGIGLGTSGNSGGVESDLQVGGENQFLIFGVQMGVLYMVIYMALLVSVIRSSIKAFKGSFDHVHTIIPFVAATFKFAFILPLMTSNAEIYLFPAFFSWWAVGFAVSLQNHNLRYSKNRIRLSNRNDKFSGGGILNY